MANKHTAHADMPGDNNDEQYVLRLYITGASQHSARAVANIKAICNTHLQGRYSLEIIDVYQQGSVAANAQLVALPLLIKVLPLPERKMIGDLSDIDKVLKTLEL